MVSITTWTGVGKGAEEQEVSPFPLRSGVMAGDGAHVRVSLRSGTVLSRKVVGETAHSPVQSDSPVRPQRNRGYTETKNRQVKKAGRSKSGRVKGELKIEK